VIQTLSTQQLLRVGQEEEEWQLDGAQTGLQGVPLVQFPQFRAPGERCLGSARIRTLGKVGVK